MPKINTTYYNIVFEGKRQFFRLKLAEVAQKGDHNIDPSDLVASLAHAVPVRLECVDGERGDAVQNSRQIFHHRVDRRGQVSRVALDFLRKSLKNII
jgi:hypothetical protein